MPTTIDAAGVKALLSKPTEIAFIDVREAGQFGEGHPFFAVPLPYSRFELELPALLPNPAVRLVLCDDGDGVASRAAARAVQIGYSNVSVLEGGVAGWKQAGYTLFQGVNLPSKAFGELIEHARHTPRLGAQDLAAMQAAGDNVVVIDGRPLAEYRKMAIPGGICCPNGEMALRIASLVPDPRTRIVVNCAGRTRSIIGAETLLSLGLPNEIAALENGTQGWFLAGLALERGADRRYRDNARQMPTQSQIERVRDVARRHGVSSVSCTQARAWIDDPARTTYLFDVRSPEEWAAGSAPGFVHAPGGQLIQATDQWVGVKGARIVLADDDGVRAPMVAAWLRQLGHEACELTGGIAAASALSWNRSWRAPVPAVLPEIEPAVAVHDLGAADVALIDLRPSMAYRAGHAERAIWAIRPRLTKSGLTTSGIGSARRVLLIAVTRDVAALAAIDLAEAGVTQVGLISGGYGAWTAAGFATEATPADPAEADCIDYLFFVHDRHEGNADAARRYLEWETGLLAQLDDQERGVFRIGPR